MSGQRTNIFEQTREETIFLLLLSLNIGNHCFTSATDRVDTAITQYKVLVAEGIITEEEEE